MLILSEPLFSYVGGSLTLDMKIMYEIEKRFNKDGYFVRPFITAIDFLFIVCY